MRREREKRREMKREKESRRRREGVGLRFKKKVQQMNLLTLPYQFL